MTQILNLTFVILCISVGIIWTAAPEISVNESHVPDVEYEADAQEALQEAYVLYPTDQEKRIERFAGLFDDLHPVAPGWNVAQGCSVLHRSLKNYTYVSLNVIDTDSNETSIVKIYN